jgi:hypothetical protein
MKKIIDDPKDPVFVTALIIGRKIVLSIGGRRHGETRKPALTTAQARILAYALLSEAVRKDDSLDQSR